MFNVFKQATIVTSFGHLPGTELVETKLGLFAKWQLIHAYRHRNEEQVGLFQDDVRYRFDGNKLITEAEYEAQFEALFNAIQKVRP